MGRHSHAQSFFTLLLAAALLFASLSGCATGEGSGSTDASSSTPVNTGLETLVGDDADDGGQADASRDDLDRTELRRRIEQQAEALPSLTEGQIPQPAEVSEGPPPKTNLSPTMEIDSKENPAAPLETSAEKEADDADSEELAQSDANTTKRQDAEPNASPGRDRDRLISELVESLQQDVERQELPLREYTALAALEMLKPGVSPDPASISTLTPREQELLTAWRDLFRRAQKGLASAGGGLGALTDAVTELARRMQQWETLEITNAELCSKVEGFGQYTPMKRRLLAGRRNRAIVYIELEHFSHKAATGPDGAAGYAVELTEELSLYHDADGLLAWRKPRQQVKDFSRNRRRDFFVVQMIELPETLTVGEYRLKITMRDQPSGAIAEAVIPIEVVADAALVRSEK